MSFNYTDTLETIYNISKDHICHIHGYVDKNDQAVEETFADYIVGHNNNSFEEDIDAFTTDPYNQQDLKDAISGYKGHKLDELESFIGHINRGGIVDIVVLGHSMGLIDAPYFKTINNMFTNANWQIGYYDERDYVSKVNSLVKLGINNFVLFEDR